MSILTHNDYMKRIMDLEIRNNRITSDLDYYKKYYDYYKLLLGYDLDNRDISLLGKLESIELENIELNKRLNKISNIANNIKSEWIGYDSEYDDS